ncbi:MAG: hypothetical protein E8D49_09120 [Nitrospira sp.]|nr:MAG: hypothetical protein E8D49_09120 [Nitrospira sp.]
MAAKMAIVEDSPKPGTRKRERIEMLERRPEEDWFIAKKTSKGATKWYIRFTITGLFPRLFGPFPTKRKALLFLDALHNTICDFWTQVDDVRDRYANEGEFENVNWGPIIEHPLATKGR